MPDLSATLFSSSSLTPANAHLIVRIARIPAEHRAQTMSLHELLPADTDGTQAWFGHSRRMVGWGEAARITVVGPHAIRDAARAWDDLRGSAHVECVCTPTCADEEMPSLPLAFGSFGFSATTPGFLIIPAVAVIEMPAANNDAPHSTTALWGTDWGGLGPARGVRYVVTTQVVPGKTSSLTNAAHAKEGYSAKGVDSASAAAQTSSNEAIPPELNTPLLSNPLAVLDAALASRIPVAASAPEGITTAPGRMTQAQWMASVSEVIELLRAGAASKVVMSRDMLVQSPSPIDPRFLLERLTSLYPTTWAYAVEGLVGATPEMLAAMHEGQVCSRVLAGTTSPGEGEALMSSMKDRTEHMFAVESVARALAPITQTLDVPEAPTVLDLPNVSHLATDVTATLASGNVLDVIAALHPTAAVCGTPTKLAFDILERFESTERGRYSGPVGWVDGAGEGEFGIALRCGQLSEDGHRLTILAGGGIMPDSIPEAELRETRAKMAPLLQALGMS